VRRLLILVGAIVLVATLDRPCASVTRRRRACVPGVANEALHAEPAVLNVPAPVRSQAKPAMALPRSAAVAATTPRNSRAPNSMPNESAAPTNPRAMHHNTRMSASSMVRLTRSVSIPSGMDAPAPTKEKAAASRSGAAGSAGRVFARPA